MARHSWAAPARSPDCARRWARLMASVEFSAGVFMESYVTQACPAGARLSRANQASAYSLDASNSKPEFVDGLGDRFRHNRVRVAVSVCLPSAGPWSWPGADPHRELGQSTK